MDSKRQVWAVRKGGRAARRPEVRTLDTYLALYLPSKGQLGSFVVAATVTPRFIKCLGSTGASGRARGGRRRTNHHLRLKDLETGDAPCWVLLILSFNLDWT